MDVAIAQENLALAFDALGDVTAPERLLLGSLDIERKHGALEHQVVTLNNLAQHYHKQGRLPESQSVYEMALSLVTDPLIRAQALNGLALVVHDLGDHARSKTLSLAAIALIEFSSAAFVI